MTQIKIVDGKTGEIVEREMTDDELAQHAADAAEADRIAAEDAARAAAKESARTKLAALGLSDDEVMALLP